MIRKRKVNGTIGWLQYIFVCLCEAFAEGRGDAAHTVATLDNSKTHSLLISTVYSIIGGRGVKKSLIRKEILFSCSCFLTSTRWGHGGGIWGLLLCNRFRKRYYLRIIGNFSPCIDWLAWFCGDFRLSHMSKLNEEEVSSKLVLGYSPQK